LFTFKIDGLLDKGEDGDVSGAADGQRANAIVPANGCHRKTATEKCERKNKQRRREKEREGERRRERERQRQRERGRPHPPLAGVSVQARMTSISGMPRCRNLLITVTRSYAGP
jgi:hypothetical protein